MESIYIFLIVAIILIVAIGVGLEISQIIDDVTIYVLFWFLYIISIITFGNIILVGFYYFTMKNKTGPAGIEGEQGERGDNGEVGKCDIDCRDKICENSLLELLNNELKERNKGVVVKMNNIYIKSKIRQMCSSDEFRQLAPYNGPLNLINYLKTIWKNWIDLIYKAGGMLYFETIGAEDDFEWQLENPFDEIKKYDVFYWGMGKQYRPQIIDKCYNTEDGDTIKLGSLGSVLNIVKTNNYENIANANNVGSYQDASFWRGKQFTKSGAVYYPVGDIVIGPVKTGDDTKTYRYVGSFIINNNGIGPIRETILVSGDVKGPINYELIWTNEGFSSTGIFYIWRPISPKGYMSLGDVITTTEDSPLTGEEAPIRCVPISKTEKQQSPPTILWSSNGSKVPVNLNLLGFIQNETGQSSLASESNCYNLMRGIIGMQTSIPESDINALFYKLKDVVTVTFGNVESSPNESLGNNYVGKGYINSEQTDSKYSVLAYLQLKNNPKLIHKKSNITLLGQIVPKSVSNLYILKMGNRCLEYSNNTTTLQMCDEYKEKQYFSIHFTGNSKNECQIKHLSTGMYLYYNSGEFKLINIPSTTNSDYKYSLFIMN